MIRRKKKSMPMIPVAAMSDIAFLLIIFFMLTSNFIKEKDIKFTPAKSADIERIKASTVSVIIDEKGDVYVQGQPCPTMAVESKVREILAGKSGDDRMVMLKVDKAITEETYFPVLLALSDADVKITTIGEKTGK